MLCRKPRKQQLSWDSKSQIFVCSCKLSSLGYSKILKSQVRMAWFYQLWVEANSRSRSVPNGRALGTIRYSIKGLHVPAVQATQSRDDCVTIATSFPWGIEPQIIHVCGYYSHWEEYVGHVGLYAPPLSCGVVEELLSLVILSHCDQYHGGHGRGEKLRKFCTISRK